MVHAAIPNLQMRRRRLRREITGTKSPTTKLWKEGQALGPALGTPRHFINASFFLFPIHPFSYYFSRSMTASIMQEPPPLSRATCLLLVTLRCSRQNNSSPKPPNPQNPWRCYPARQEEKLRLQVDRAVASGLKQKACWVIQVDSTGYKCGKGSQKVRCQGNLV